jgi:hypothetical protein
MTYHHETKQSQLLKMVEGELELELANESNLSISDLIEKMLPLANTYAALVNALSVVKRTPV